MTNKLHPNELQFPANIAFVTRDMANDVRRIAALIRKEEPNTSVSQLMAMISYQLGLALGHMVDKRYVEQIGAKSLTEASYNFNHGAIAAMLGEPL